MKEIIKKDRLYLAMPPLFKIKYKDTINYAYNEKEKDRLLNEKYSKLTPSISRFKGLGEMPADELKKTTMDINNRKLIRITLLDGLSEEKKTNKLFETLMGKKAEYRFKFIQENANFVNIVDF
jgi:DNA gyrase/topoisomerase IV subunit B